MLYFAKRVVMNKIYIPLFLALVLSLLVLWKSHEKEKEPFCVTYHVSTHTLSEHKLIITYTDAQGIVQETFIGQRWNKRVSLPSEGIASLRIDEIFNPDTNLYHSMPQEQEMYDPIVKEFTMHPFSIWIEHEKKVVLATGDNSLHVSLLPSEIK